MQKEEHLTEPTRNQHSNVGHGNVYMHTLACTCACMYILILLMQMHACICTALVTCIARYSACLLMARGAALLSEAALNICTCARVCMPACACAPSCDESCCCWSALSDSQGTQQVATLHTRMLQSVNTTWLHFASTRLAAAESNGAYGLHRLGFSSRLGSVDCGLLGSTVLLDFSKRG